MIDARSSKSLWGAVVIGAIRDLTNRSTGGRSDREEAERWVGTYPLKDFCIVLSNAGLEPKAAWDWFHRLTTLPPKERAEAAKSIFKHPGHLARKAA